MYIFHQSVLYKLSNKFVENRKFCTYMQFSPTTYIKSFNPFTVPSKIVKRKSLSASGQKRRSLLPTPLGNRITRSQSQRSRPTSVNCDVKGALPFNISPSAEIKPKAAAVASEDSQADLSLEPSLLHSRLSDPFSPASQAVTVDPIEDYSGSNSVVRNLIELSPMPATEVSEYILLFPHFLAFSSPLKPH